LIACVSSLVIVHMYQNKATAVAIGNPSEDTIVVIAFVSILFTP